MQGSGDEQDDVIDHVAVCDVVQEFGHRLDALVANVLEFGHELLLELFINGGDGQRASLVGQEVAVVGGLEVKLEV